ncbi:MAG TPA: exo 1,3/1,4-beta-D-glucan glucohydrolase [Rhizomicrobium sp.]|jgi:beta-glucosidase
MGARRTVCIIVAGLALSACAIVSQTRAESPSSDGAAVVHPEIWPKLTSGVAPDPAIEARVADLLSRMTVEDKVGQIIQADVASVTPDDVRKYRLGSVLDGGNSGPYGNDRALPPTWLKEADEFYAASMDTSGGHLAIPVSWGSDSVHGNSNIIGATVFPHNIGLGAARDPELLREIGEITAIETRVVGQDWTFAPTIAVVQDDRWGRTYESYSENPQIVRAYAYQMVRGIQGDPIAPDFLRGPHIIATAKHFLGDGGTDQGHDQGDNLSSEEDLRDIHSAGYQSAIEAGVQSVMVSFSDWHGQKMSGNRALLEDVLRGRLGFNGFTVSDWNAHGQLPGCTLADCPAALLAGIDMYMAPDSWKGLYANTVAEVKSGQIPMARLDEAVSRILRVKLRAGVFEAGPPSRRSYGGKWDELASPEHRAVARQAVRESLVLLKNEHQLLPLKPGLNVLVAGNGANDMGKQTGGWTISWQGTGNTRADFPRAQTVYEGIAAQVNAAHGTPALSIDGSFRRKPDVAIVVFGEDPYAEFMGDRPNLAFEPGDSHDLQLLRSLKAQGIPVIAVFLSGRPMYLTREINVADAFVAAWLPGTEGGGIADVLFRKPDGSIQYDFRGRLSFSWPRSPNQTPLNWPGPNAPPQAWQSYNPLFAYGYGLDYAHPRDIGQLPEAPEGELVSANNDTYLHAGHAAAPWILTAMDASGVSSPVTRLPAQIGAVSLSSADYKAQEDTLAVRWNGSGRAGIALTGTVPINLSRQTNGDMALQLALRVDEAPSAPVMLGGACGANCSAAIDIAQPLRTATKAGWTTVNIRLSCLKAAGLKMDRVTTPFSLTTSGQLGLSLTAVKLVPGEGPPVCPAPQQS